MLAGDTSWAMSLSECDEDFAFLHALPGKKVLLKGNHDYWWCTMAKMERYLEEKKFSSISFLHNNCVQSEGDCFVWQRSQLVYLIRESRMMKNYAESAAVTDCVSGSSQRRGESGFLHYPPIYPRADAQQVVEILKTYHVKRCFGHLHGGVISARGAGECGRN